MLSQNHTAPCEEEDVSVSVSTSEQTAVAPDSASYLPLPFDLTAAQASAILDIYRTRFVRNFPFVPIPKGVSAEVLLRQKPMVFRSVMLVAAPLPIRRVEAIQKEVLGFLGAQLLVGDNRSLQILQGALICIAW